jgi:hypothetical protein
MVTPGPYTLIQTKDPITGGWRTVPSQSNSPVFVISDGASFRVANLTGCALGAFVTNVGSGYTSAPTVTASSGNSTWQAIVGGAVSTTVNLSNLGSGYTYPPIVQFPAPAAGGMPATATCTLGVGAGAIGTPVMSAGTLASITVANGGGGYGATAPLVYITGGGGTGATATATLTAGVITSFTVTAPGSGYITTPTVLIAGTGTISAITMVDQGAGYTFPPVPTFTNDLRDTTGSGGAAVTTLTGAGTVTGVLCLNHGTALTAVPTLSFAGGGGASAAATAVMCFTATGIGAVTAGAGYGASLPFLVLSVGGEVGGAAGAVVNPSQSTGLLKSRMARIAGTSSAGGAVQAAGAVIEDGGLFSAAPGSVVISSGLVTTQGAAPLNYGGSSDTVLIQPV